MVNNTPHGSLTNGHGYLDSVAMVLIGAGFLWTMDGFDMVAVIAGFFHGSCSVLYKTTTKTR